MNATIRSFRDLPDAIAERAARERAMADLDELRGRGGFTPAQMRLMEYAMRRAADDGWLFLETVSKPRGMDQWLTLCMRELEQG